MIVISRYIKNKLNAGPKAKMDVENIAKKFFNAKIRVLNYTEEEESNKIKNIFFKLKKLFFSLKNIRGTELTIIQFPYSNEIVLTKRAKNKVAFIHDLDGLRRKDEELNKREIKFLSTCKCIIAHNKRMKNYLIEQGIEKNKIYELGLFDYLCKDANTEYELGEIKNIAYVGNLSKEKSPYIYQIEQEKMNFNLLLYGNGINEIKNEKIKYMGSFKPEELPNKIEANLGLVWDGNYDESDENNTFKNYTRYNNPHKLSCYIAAGLPVIVWGKSAVADFVKEKNIGYTIRNVYDINNIDMSDYDVKKKNIKEIQTKVRSGFYTKKILEEISQKER